MGDRRDLPDDLTRRMKAANALLAPGGHSADPCFVRAELATRLPLHVLAFAAEAGARVVVRGEEEPFREEDRYESVRPLGLTDRRRRIVYLRGRLPHVAAHEIGHVVDFVAEGTWGLSAADLGYAEGPARPALEAALSLALSDGYDALHPREHVMGDAREFFAESFAAYHGAALRWTGEAWERLAARDVHPAALALVEGHLEWSLVRPLGRDLAREDAAERAL